MIIKKRLNNNVVLVEKNGNDYIVFGNGIGFKAYPGNQIDETRVEQTFISSEHFDIYAISQLLCDASLEDIQMTQKIIDIGKQALKTELNSNLIFTLLDHLSFALKRFEKNVPLQSPIEWEIKTIYHKETSIGEQALEIMKQAKQIQLPQSEVAFIALHFVNAQFENESMDSTLELTTLINEISTIIKYFFRISIEPESLSYKRFCTHLRYYLVRQKQHVSVNLVNQELYYMIKERYPKESDCADRITTFIENEYLYPTLDDEKLYLILHINRLIHQQA